MQILLSNSSSAWFLFNAIPGLYNNNAFLKSQIDEKIDPKYDGTTLTTLGTDSSLSRTSKSCQISVDITHLWFD